MLRHEFGRDWEAADFCGFVSEARHHAIHLMILVGVVSALQQFFGGGDLADGAVSRPCTEPEPN
jgi:hypothetical protein